MNSIEYEEDDKIGLWDEPIEYDYVSWKLGYSYSRRQKKDNNEKDEYGHTPPLKEYHLILYP